MRYRFHPSAEQELEAALAYYDAINFDLGETFLNEIEQTIQRIISFPDAWTKFSQDTHRCRVLGFPYGIIYQIKNQEILIIAVMHLQRKPNYWSDRL